MQKDSIKGELRLLQRVEQLGNSVRLQRKMNIHTQGTLT